MLGFDMRHAAGGQAARWTTGERVNEQRLACGDTGSEPGSLDSLGGYGHSRSLGACWQQSVQSLWGPPATASAEEQLDANNTGRVVDHMAPNHIIRTCTAFLTFSIGCPLLSCFL